MQAIWPFELSALPRRRGRPCSITFPFSFKNSLGSFKLSMAPRPVKRPSRPVHVPLGRNRTFPVVSAMCMAENVSSCVIATTICRNFCRSASFAVGNRAVSWASASSSAGLIFPRQVR